MVGKLPFVVFMSRSKIGWVPSIYTLPPVCKFCDGDLCVGNNRVSHFSVFGWYEIVVQGEKEYEANATYQNIGRQTLDMRCARSETVHAIDESVKCAEADVSRSAR
jgi:hypothetical protein